MSMLARMTGNDLLDDEDATPVACRDCDGHYEIEQWSGTRYSKRVCEFCTRGCMSPSQFLRWMQERGRRRDPISGVRERR